MRSVELERLTAEGITLVERRNCLELFRDQAIERFEVYTGSSWRPRSGSLVNHRTLTAAMIDSRDFIAAKRRADTEVMVPPGPKIALTGGLDFNDHHLIWDRLDKVHAKHPDMVLIHGGSPKGAELIASKWADSPEGATDRFQAGLDKARQGSSVQTQRRHARAAADRCHAFPGHGNPGQPRRQSETDRHRGLEVRRRINAVCRLSHHPGGVAYAATPPRFDAISKLAPRWWWKARPLPLCTWSHHHARPWTRPQHRWHRSVLLADLHAGGLRLAVLCLMWPAT